MKKSLYSLILADEVVAEIDRLAREENTNRSNLVNEILAEYVSLTTPEKHMDHVFRAIESIMPMETFSLFSEPHGSTLSIKSSLRYKYRPTLRYEVDLGGAPGYSAGVLKVHFRTQSPELLLALTDFFKIWIRLEDLYIRKFFPEAIRYSLEEGKFTRSFEVPLDRTYDAEELGRAIGNYIETFDGLLKSWLSGELADERDLESAYVEHINRGLLVI